MEPQDRTTEQEATLETLLTSESLTDLHVHKLLWTPNI